MKQITFGWVASLLLLLTSCYDDEGNYDYSEVPVINIENINETNSLLKGADLLELRPKITSSIEGEIAADNPNFEYECWIAKTSGRFNDNQMWHDMNPDRTQGFDYLAAEDEGAYIGRYIVTDKRTGISTNHQFDITITSSVYEGWMVLCNEGEEERVRLDMVSVISLERVAAMHDILNASFPEIHHATSISLERSVYSRGDEICLMSEEGSYKLNQNKLTATAKDNMVDLDFLAPIGDDSPVRQCIVGPHSYGSYGCLVSTREGNLHFMSRAVYGGGYELPVNTFVEGEDPAYRISPYIATGMDRPGSTVAVLTYDIDNKRFMGWSYENNDGTVSLELTDPGNALFSYTTGQELLYMEGTRFSNNLVYSVLQDASGARSIYGINLSGSKFTQEAYYPDVQAENFDKATHFTFHSQYPYMFYGAGDKVYSYNLGTKAGSSVTLDGEEITMVKIDLFKSLSLEYIPEDILPQQHYVLVGSYKKNATDNNGGILRMYQLDRTTGQLNLVHEYTGFAKIVDVTYRERFTMIQW